MNLLMPSSLYSTPASWSLPSCFSSTVICRSANISSASTKSDQLHGVMFKYGRKPIQVAFKTGDYRQQVIFVAGQSDGFVATRYLQPLATALDKEKWSLVQFLLTSSYSGYGMSSLNQDAKELDQLIKFLVNKDESDGVVLLGHSTGCQDIVHYLRTNAASCGEVRAAILQAPVSDREYNATLPQTVSMLDLASKMISEGQGFELMPKKANRRVPMTAYRYHSLCSYNGDDDLFSSDLSEEQLRERLGHMSNIPCQVIFSMADEYVPQHVDKKPLVDRLCRAMGGAEKVEMEGGNHALSNRVEEAVATIVDFVKRRGPKTCGTIIHRPFVRVGRKIQECSELS